MDPHPANDYELEVTSERNELVVRLQGRVTAEAGRHLREVIAAARKCGVPVTVSYPGDRRDPAHRSSRQRHPRPSCA